MMNKTQFSRILRCNFQRSLAGSVSSLPSTPKFPQRFASTTAAPASSPVSHPLSFLPWQFLRAADASNFDPDTNQRKDIPCDAVSGKPIPGSATAKTTTPVTMDEILNDEEREHYIVRWSDGVESSYSKEWLDDILHQRSFESLSSKPERVYWQGLTEEDIRDSQELSISFSDLITPMGMKRALQTIYQYGILLVTDTPTEGGAGVAALGASLSGGSVKDLTSTSLLANYLEGGTETILEHGTDGPLRTLYGSVWSTSSGSQEEGTSKADSAYGNDSLPLHTDMTYMREPPGLQIFTMVQPAVEGGESVFGDGFALADELRKVDPVAFKVLSRTMRRFRCLDHATGWNLQAVGPMISVGDGRLVSIRHNDLDRLPDLPPSFISDPEEINAFYTSLDRAHKTWDELLTEDRFRLEMKLQPGDTMVVANQRCFHGRLNFKSTASTPRIVMGCYVSQDELSSRFRQEGFEDL